MKNQLVLFICTRGRNTCKEKGVGHARNLFLLGRARVRKKERKRKEERKGMHAWWLD